MYLYSFYIKIIFYQIHKQNYTNKDKSLLFVHKKMYMKSGLKMFQVTTSAHPNLYIKALYLQYCCTHKDMKIEFIYLVFILFTNLNKPTAPETLHTLPPIPTIKLW